MLANWITISRLPLLLICVLILYLGSPPLQVAGTGLLFLGLMLDTVDGLVARRTGRTSLLGSVLDIAADRTYELALWVCFAYLRLIPAAMPLVVVFRTTLTAWRRAARRGRLMRPDVGDHRNDLANAATGRQPGVPARRPCA
jgi:phosphatidylglycerophosphate synthase